MLTKRAELVCIIWMQGPTSMKVKKRFSYSAQFKLEVVEFAEKERKE